MVQSNKNVKIFTVGDEEIFIFKKDHNSNLDEDFSTLYFTFKR